MKKLDEKFGVTQEYDPEEDSRNVEGTDNNNDGVRDALLNITKSFAFFYPDMSKSHFDELYRLSIDIQPKAGPPWNTNKSEKEFQCRFAKLKKISGMKESFTEFKQTIIFAANKRSAYAISKIRYKGDPYICDIDFVYEH